MSKFLEILGSINRIFMGRGGWKEVGFRFSIIEIDFPVPLMSCRLKAFSPDILGKLSLLNARLK